MGTLYEKPVRVLLRDMVRELGIEHRVTFSREQARAWFKENYPNVKQGTISAHLLRMSVNAPSRVHHNPKPVEDDLLYQVDAKRFRLYQPGEDPDPIYSKGPDGTYGNETEEGDSDYVATDEFAYEKDLQNYLARNLDLIEPGLSLFEEEGITGLEFPAGGRFVDILAVDQDGNYVVIELKVSKGYDRVVGQLLRYMAWIKKHQAEPGTSVRGVIVAREISEDLLLACSTTPGVQLFEYKLSVELRRAMFEN